MCIPMNKIFYAKHVYQFSNKIIIRKVTWFHFYIFILACNKKVRLYKKKVIKRFAIGYLFFVLHSTTTCFCNPHYVLHTLRQFVHVGVIQGVYKTSPFFIYL